MKVKIKRLSPDAVLPTYARKGDAGMDLTAVSKSYDEFGNIVYGTGLAFEIPEGYVGLVFPRSSICRTALNVKNSVGVIDPGYRGEVTLKFNPTLLIDVLSKKARFHEDVTDYLIGERIGQILIVPIAFIEWIEVDALSKTERGEGGYGSTGL